jgi:hypothetical protein
MHGSGISLRTRVIAETRRVLLLFVYLWLLLGTFTMYRRLVLAEYHIGYFRYGYSLIEALVLAKIVLIGRYLRLGEGFRQHPLIVPTLYKTLWFSTFVLVFCVLEHLILGWWHDEPALVTLRRLGTSHTGWEILAQVLVLFLALLPMFGVWETGRLLGEGTLYEWFFRRRTGTVQQRLAHAGAPLCGRNDE